MADPIDPAALAAALAAIAPAAPAPAPPTAPPPNIDPAALAEFQAFQQFQAARAAAVATPAPAPAPPTPAPSTQVPGEVDQVRKWDQNQIRAYLGRTPGANAGNPMHWSNRKASIEIAERLAGELANYRIASSRKG